VERIDRYASPDNVERAWADMLLGLRKYLTGDNLMGQRIIAKALDLARRLGDRDAFWSAAMYFAHYGSAPQHTQERIRLVEELVVNSPVRPKGFLSGQANAMMSGVFLGSV